VFPSNTVVKRATVEGGPHSRTVAPSKSKPIFSSVRAFQHRRRAHSTAQLFAPARAGFWDPLSLLPVQRIQTLWRGNYPPTSAWQPRCCGNQPDHGSSLSTASGSRRFCTTKFLDVPNTGLKMNPMASACGCVRKSGVGSGNLSACHVESCGSAVSDRGLWLQYQCVFSLLLCETCWDNHLGQIARAEDFMSEFPPQCGIHN
jgi:hypothetical protein